jgi:hypothetical protein
MKISLWIALATALILPGCGGSSTSTDFSGNWAATLSNTASTTVYVFNAAFTQTSADAVTVAGLKFTTGGAPCFEELGSQTGQLTIGSTSTTLQLTILGAQPGASSLNTLTLEGTVSGSNVSGTWVLQGFGGCTGSGNFTMTKS